MYLALFEQYSLIRYRQLTFRDHKEEYTFMLGKCITANLSKTPSIGLFE